MIDPKLAQYVRQQQLSGMQKQDIVNELLSAGWTQEYIDEIFLSMPGPTHGEARMVPEQISAPGALDLKAKKNNTFKNFLVIAAAAVFFTAVIAGSLFAYDYFFPSPEAVMQRMALAMAEIKTAEYESRTNLEISGEAGGIPRETPAGKNENIKLNIEARGAFDNANIGEPKNSADIKISADQFLNGVLGVNFISIGEIGYFKISAGDLPLDSLSGGIGSGQWVKIDYDKFSREAQKIYPSLAERLEKENVKNMPLTDEQNKALRALARQLKIFKVDRQFADQAVNGKNCRHYSVAVDKEALRQYIRGVGEIIRDRVSQQQIGMFVDFADSADFSGIELWVAKDDYTLRRVNGKMASEYDFLGMIKININADAAVDFKTINQPLAIEAPRDAKDYFDIFKNYTGSVNSSYVPTDDARAKARDARRLSDMRQMMAAQEMYYGDEDRYYTCGTKGGDCSGKPNNWPAIIGNYITKTATDPLASGTICGQDYIYCGLDNTKNSDKFCYYTKLEATENYKYYTATHAGGFKRNAAPKTLEECATEETGTGGSAAANGASPQARDAYRMSDMRQMVSAEEMFYGDNDRYYTCGLKGGDCGGKSHYFPETIKPYINQKLADPLNDGNVCGQGYIYCGIDNTKEKEKFCFYAKLEGGGYYTASHAGNFKRATAPKTIDECAAAN